MAESDTPKCALKLAWKCSPSRATPALCSPMTDLAMNLEELTCLVDTPKRRISWSSDVSSTSSSSPARPQLLSFRDDGFYDSPNTVFEDSPVIEERLEMGVCREKITGPLLGRSRSLLQRLHSAPASSLSHYLEKENFPRVNNNWSSPTKPCAKDDGNIDDQDSTSRDSGYCEKDEFSVKRDFKFTEPVGIAPRRLRSANSLSPAKTVPSQLLLSPVSLITIPLSYSQSQFSETSEPFDRICNGEEADDDGFMDEIDLDIPNENISTGIAQLISAKMPALNSLNSSKSSSSRPPLHDFCNVDLMDTPRGKSCIRGLFGGKKSDQNDDMDRKMTLKRSEVPRDYLSPIQNKRRKSVSFCQRKFENRLDADELKEIAPKRVTLQRCYSETEATIMSAVQRSVQEPNLIGDFSRPYVLPMTFGKHQDLNNICHATVNRLLMGEFSNEVETFLIVDCRYPYEYDGGHIKGALNIYTKEGIVHEFLCNPLKVTESNKRLLVVFHCEFSSERGPNLSRFLRNKDREANKECYPQLFYPEIYLLDGGYKSFFENHQAMCEPQEYKPMLHKDHEKDMRHFRAKSKSWNGDKASRLGPRPGLKL